uniref:Uncharacterized protein n=1 Tax=Anguilla anguilla TaxID=7936 RepID=A0A0E9WWH4_ANGAN
MDLNTFHSFELHLISFYSKLIFRQLLVAPTRSHSISRTDIHTHTLQFTNHLVTAVNDVNLKELQSLSGSGGEGWQRQPVKGWDDNPSSPQQKY